MNKRVDGKILSQEILANLQKRVTKLRQKKIIPSLAIIQVGKNKAGEAYIRQKIKTSRKIGVHLEIFSFSPRVSFQKLAEKIKELNENKKIHGLIIQRPLPAWLRTQSFNQAVVLTKDIDGFHRKSPFNAPVAEAVLYILKKIYLRQENQEEKLLTILKHKKILLLGRGETAGSPIAKTFSKYGLKFLIAHSKTKNIAEFAQDADIIISCVGKRKIVKKEIPKEGVILLGVGISREKERLYGDYEETEIKEKAAYYTPTPGGVGPLNIAFLMQNLVTACEKQSQLSPNKKKSKI